MSEAPVGDRMVPAIVTQTDVNVRQNRSLVTLLRSFYTNAQIQNTQNHKIHQIAKYIKLQNAQIHQITKYKTSKLTLTSVRPALDTQINSEHLNTTLCCIHLLCQKKLFPRNLSLLCLEIYSALLRNLFQSRMLLQCVPIHQIAFARIALYWLALNWIEDPTTNVQIQIQLAHNVL